ncbi:hypothetical protein NLI96_g2617 [Meripilus lineatus]|uniref:AB hydrolase-1 domain-containing protein n=1 Tax=Meripilus lineatus TaxID=2056292 RepID=A0AAD5VAF1_9APHY|nr:hypothetical protein NLI96_g2617 [Physisporinus lineatus]
MTQAIEGNAEKYLQLPGERILAYAHSGYPDSEEVVIFFHGVFGVGLVHTERPSPPIFEEKRVHFIAPTLPGWGNSSPPPPSTSFRDYLYEVTTTLINHLYNDTTKLRLYISGGSYGTVPAQMLYGAPYDSFPLGRQIVGLLLGAPFSSPRAHKEFNKCLSWGNWIAVGTPSQVIPGNLIMRLGSMGMKSNVNTPERARAFIKKFGFTNLTPEERVAYEKWKEAKEIKSDEEAVAGMAEGVYRSIEKTWEGFYETANVIHSDWGFSPQTLDEEHSKGPVLVVMTYGDKDTLRMGEWLAGNYKNGHGRYEHGGHIASMFVMDDIWADFMGRCLVNVNF